MSYFKEGGKTTNTDTEEYISNFPTKLNGISDQGKKIYSSNVYITCIIGYKYTYKFGSHEFQVAFSCGFHINVLQKLYVNIAYI